METRTQTQNVLQATVKYRLSEAGQKAALRAGRQLPQEVTEVMDCPVELLDAVSMQPDGALTFNASVQPAWDLPVLCLDAPPESLKELVAAYAQHASEAEAAKAERYEAQRRKEQAEQDLKAQKIADNAPLIKEVLDNVAASDPLTDLPYVFNPNYGGNCIYLGGEYIPVEAAEYKRAGTLRDRHVAAKQAENDRLLAERSAKIEAIVTEHGGYHWRLAGGFCSFSGYSLWNKSQDHRWVGVFSKAKGIDRFLDSPRNEHTFDVSRLNVGELIQGGGYDTNSRGKRRNETEFFGVVVRRTEEELVVKMVDSRAAAFKAAKVAKES